MPQEIIATIGAVILGVLLEEVIRRNRQRKKYEIDQLCRLDNIAFLQKKHTEEIGFVKKQTTLARIDSASAVYALRKASNGIPFNQYIEEERKRLVDFYKIEYED